VGAAETPCRATLLERDELPPGATGWAQLRLDRPIAVARGDRYILRQPSPSHTLGGGRVVDISPPRHRRFRPEVAAALEALARGRPADLLLRTLDDGQPHAWAELLKAGGLPEGLAAEALSELLGDEKVVLLGEDDKMTRWQDDKIRSDHLVTLSSCHLVTAKGWSALSEKLATALRGYHRRYPLRAGMPREELRSRLRLTGDGLEAVLATAAAQGLAATHEASVRLAGHAPAPTPEQQRAVRRLLDAFRAVPYGPPALDLEPELAGWLVEQGHVVRVAPDVAFLPQTYDEMVGWVRAQIAAAGGVTVAQFRDHFGSSRKYALALLEHLDERKVTRRAGDARVLY
ncbi:MAG TPA: SelB C-terminal domain-containing protein, partial [Roseiflexaceae bacterium]